MSTETGRITTSHNQVDIIVESGVGGIKIALEFKEENLYLQSWIINKDQLDDFLVALQIAATQQCWSAKVLKSF